MEDYNDKFRSKMAHEKFFIQKEQGSISFFNKIKNQNLAVATFAPDLVAKKWNGKWFKYEILI